MLYFITNPVIKILKYVSDFRNGRSIYNKKDINFLTLSSIFQGLVNDQSKLLCFRCDHKIFRLF